MDAHDSRPPGVRTRGASRRRPLALLGLCAFVTVVAVAQPAAGSALKGGESTFGHPTRHVVRHLKALSGPTPFPAGCPGAAQDDTHIAGAEIEPAVTTDPTHPRTVVATWQQDLGFGGRSDLIATSHDGGRTWTRHTIPGLTRCTGGTADSASDPWLAAGGDGTIYFTGAAISLATDPPVGTNVSSTSRDRGRHWTRPPSSCSWPCRCSRATCRRVSNGGKWSTSTPSPTRPRVPRASPTAV